MGFYRERAFPRIMDAAMDTEAERAIRPRVCAPLAGAVLEIGFGSGLNLPHLPPAVTVVHAVEPLDRAFELSAERRRRSHVRVERSGLDGQTLPLDDASADAALSTWTLCSIPDAVAAIREVRRVLRPGGVLHFVEHGRAPDRSVRRWQDRLDPLQQRIACGCHLNRDIPALLAAGGMRVERLDRSYTDGTPKVLGATYEGAAVAADA
jgi:SAM-dependent methyltransferase